MLDHLGVGPADMIGLSMGGAHLLRDQTSDAPRLDVRRLVLVSAGGPPVSGPARQALARFDGTLESMRAQVRLAFADPSWADDEEFPGLGRWSNQAWWKLTPPVARAGGKASNVGNTGAASHVDPAIAAQEFPGFASVSMPGVLRIAYPKFIHYEFYVPVDAGHHRYVGVMVSFRQGCPPWPSTPST